MYIQLAVHTENPIYCKNLTFAHKTKDTDPRVCSNRLAMLYVARLMLTSGFKNKRELQAPGKKGVGKTEKKSYILHMACVCLSTSHSLGG